MNCLHINEIVGPNCRIPLNIRFTSLHGCPYSLFYSKSFSFAQFSSGSIFPVPASRGLSVFKNKKIWYNKKCTKPPKHLKGWINSVVMLYVDFATWEKLSISILIKNIHLNERLVLNILQSENGIGICFLYILPLSSVQYFPVRFYSLLVKGGEFLFVW